jgi:hypothetical protein
MISSSTWLVLVFACLAACGEEVLVGREVVPARITEEQDAGPVVAEPAPPENEDDDRDGDEEQGGDTGDSDDDQDEVMQEGESDSEN